MDSLLLRLAWVFIFLHLIQAVPTMNAIRDESRLDDGKLLIALFLRETINGVKGDEYMDLLSVDRIHQPPIKSSVKHMNFLNGIW